MKVRLLVGCVLGAALLAGGLPSAAAHVTARATEVTDDGVATVTFSFDHGCEGQPTTALRVAIPADGVADVAPEAAAGFEVTTAPGEFGWTGGPVPDGQRATFTATMRVWGEEGATIWLKAVQDCPEGQEAWIEEQAPGAPEPEYVAPRIVLPRTIEPPETTTTSGAPSTAATPAPTTSSTVVAAAISEDGSPSTTTGLVVFLVVCAVLAGGSLTLFLRHRRTGQPPG